MSGGGGGGHTTSDVTQTTSNLPEYAEPYYHDLMQRGAFETSQPYETYGGQRVADFSPYEQEGMARMGELGMSGTNQSLLEAGQLASRVGQQGIGGIGYGGVADYAPNAMGGAGAYNPRTRGADYQAGQLGPNAQYSGGQRSMGFEPGTLNDPGMMQSYMSPYQQNVTDINKREAMRDADIRHQQTGLGAAQAGSLGGYREAIMRSETERDLGQRLDDIQVQGQQDAFSNAQQAYEADRGARAQQETFGQSQFGMNEQIKQRQAELMQSGFTADEAARQAQEQFGQSQFGMNSFNKQFGAQMGLDRYNAQEAARQAAQGFGLQAADAQMQGQIANANAQLGSQQNQLQASQQMGGFANQQQQQEMERLGLLQGVGSQQRGLAQQGLDAGYQDFLRQQGYPMEQLSFMNNLLQGNAMSPGSTTTVYGQQPSNMQQMLGSGIAGMGMYNAYQGMGG